MNSRTGREGRREAGADGQNRVLVYHPGHIMAASNPQSLKACVSSPPKSGGAVVECVIGAWREGNLAPVIGAFRQQTVPCAVTVVTSGRSAEGGEFPEALLSLADRVYRTSMDCGAFTRYLPAASFAGEFVYLHDDDMLPGPRAVEHLLAEARIIGDFGVLGQMGRIFTAGEYVARYPERLRCPRRVDMLVRSYFMPVSCCSLVLKSLPLLDLVPERDDIEDDLILAWSMARAGKLCYLASRSDDPESRVNLRELDTTGARSGRRKHFVRRGEFVRRHWRAEWFAFGGGLRHGH